MAEGVCVVKQTRRALYRHWQLAEGEAAPVRGLLARAARLTTEITLGRGEPGHLVALDEVALELAAQGLAAAWPLGSSLRYYRAQWEQHVRRESCPEGFCLERKAAPCHRTCPANIDIPSFIAHLGHGDYRATIEVIRRDNPLPLVCGLVCPAPCESACVRGGSNGAVFIRPLKAKAAEHCLAEGGYPRAGDRARHRQAHRHRRLRPVQSHRGLLPAHLRPPGRDLRGAGAGGRAVALRHSGLSPAARSAGAGDRPDPGAGRPNPHQRPDRQPRRIPQGLRRRLPRPRHPARAPHSRSRASSSPSCWAGWTSCMPCAAANRCRSGRAWSSSAAATSPSTSP